MLEQLLTYLHNWFRVRDSVDGKHPGTYTVESGSIVLPFLQNGQYFRIIGSVFNDGLYIYGSSILDEERTEIELTDETFTGSIWALAIPKAVMSDVKALADVDGKISKVSGDFVENPYTSENYFGVYSRTIGVSEQLSVLTAQRDEITARLRRWRKMRED